MCPQFLESYILAPSHYIDIIMGAKASQITSLTIVYSTGNRWIPTQMPSNTENVFIWWRHHDSGESVSL